ncbi:MAG TPA: hypothetical protein VGJ16_06285 [Pirellulales bacterium]
MANRSSARSQVASVSAIILSVIVSGFIATAAAQQIIGTPGSPSATATIKSDQIPSPAPKFGG